MLESRRAEQDGLDLSAETIPVVDGVAVIPPAEAIRFVRESVPLPSRTFDAIVAAARTRSEAFANQLAQDLPRALQERLLRHLQEGGTIDQFVTDLGGHLSDLGVTPQNPNRLHTIVKTNTASAYNAGRVQMYRAPAVRAAFPFWQYVTAGDAAVRPEHAAMDGQVFRADDPIWDVWLPPNGFNCRCVIVVLDDEDMADEGLRVSTSAPDLDGQAVTPDAGFARAPQPLADARP